MAGDLFGVEPPRPGGSVGAHAASHKAGGADALLAAPGEIGGGTPAPITGTTITAVAGFAGDGSQLTNLPAVGAAYLSPVELYGTLASSYGLSPGDFLGDYTTGGKYVGLTALSIGGVRGLRYTADCTYTAKLWVGGVAVASKSQAVTAGAPFEILFDTPYTVPLGSAFLISVYDGGTRYSYTTSAPSWEPADYGFYPVADGLYLIQSLYASGDNVPATVSGHRVPLEPIVL